jgi:hypothetical protein
MKVRVNEKDVTEVAQRIALNLNDREGEKPWNESNLYFQRRSHWAKELFTGLIKKRGMASERDVSGFT